MATGRCSRGHRISGLGAGRTQAMGFEYSKSGTFGLEKELTLIDEERPGRGWGDEKAIEAALASLSRSGPVAWDPAAVQVLQDQTGLSRAAASLLLATLPSIDLYEHNFLSSETRQILDIKVGEAKAARDQLKSLSVSGERLTILDAAMPPVSFRIVGEGPRPGRGTDRQSVDPVEGSARGDRRRLVGRGRTTAGFSGQPARSAAADRGSDGSSADTRTTDPCERQLDGAEPSCRIIHQLRASHHGDRAALGPCNLAGRPSAARRVAGSLDRGEATPDFANARSPARAGCSGRDTRKPCGRWGLARGVHHAGPRFKALP